MTRIKTPAAVAMGSMRSAKKAAASRENGKRKPLKYGAADISNAKEIYALTGTISDAAEQLCMSRATVSRMVRGVYFKEGAK